MASAHVDPQRPRPNVGSLIDSVKALLRELPELISDRVDLLSLELTRAGRALAQMVGWIVVSSIAVLTAWVALCGAVVATLVQFGLPWPHVLLGLSIFNLLVGWWAVSRARALAPRLRLPASRRQLTFRSSANVDPLTPDETRFAH